MIDSRARTTLLVMLPLRSMMMPIETGASSAEKLLICCCELFS